MLNKRLELLGIIIRQALHGGLVEHLAAETPAQAQLAAVHLAVDFQPVAQWRVEALIGTGSIARRCKQTALAGVVETAVELAQVVEGDARTWQLAQCLLRSMLAQVAQRAEAQALVRNCAQLLLDAFERIRQARRRHQLQRVEAGEPADRARQVNVIEHVFAAMAFQPDQHRRGSRPAHHHPGQGRQQKIVDLGAVGAWGFLQ